MPSTVFKSFEARARQQPSADFLHVEAVTANAYGIDAGSLSYGDTLARIEALRARYAAAGYGHGHRAGLLLENRPDFFLHWFALNALGVSVVPINNDMRAAELGYLLAHSELCLAISLPQRIDDLRAAAEPARVPVLLALGHEGTVPQAPWPAPKADVPITRDSECALLYTSGTTGRPKGCVLSNDYFLLAGQWYASVGGLCSLREDAERMITPLPLTHMNAMAYSAMAMLTTGGCLVQLDRFHPGTWWQSVRESKATVAHYLGVMPAMLLGAPASTDDRAHNVRFGFGAGVDRRQQPVFEDRFGFPLLEAWAMTETGAGAVVIANREPRHVGQSCFGRAEAAVEWRLVDEAGADVAVGDSGELWVRAAGADPKRGFFSEYLKDEAATAEAWADGWFHTGDLVRADAQGNLYFVDRQKNVIRRSGENISAVEVESVLAQHPRVAAVAVAAAPDAVRGDEVLACIVLRDREAADEPDAIAADITRHALGQLAYYKAPGYVAFVDALPLTLSQKVQRAQLKSLAQSLPGQPNCIDTRAMKKRANMSRRGYEGVAVAVPVTVPYERFSTKGAPWFLGRVLAELVKQSGIAKDHIDGLCVSSFSLGPDTAVGLTQHLGVSPRWLDHVPMGGASGVVAVRRAARAVQAGDADVVACISGDTNHVDSFRQMLGSFSAFARDATWPYGSGGPNSMFAFITAHAMRTQGAKREDFGRICVAQRQNALGIEHAMFKKPLTLDEYMDARVIADPIHLFDCVMPCAGGDGVLVMSEARARDLGLRFVKVLGATERHNAYRDDPIMFRGGWSVDRDELFAMAGITPKDLDLVQFYDDYPVIVMMQYEGHGLCGEGEGAEFVRAHTLDCAGTMPTNTSGGQLSMGQAGAAGGYLGLVETVRQLTDAPLGMAVPDANIGLVSGFGMITYDRCLCTGALILARSD